MFFKLLSFYNPKFAGKWKKAGSPLSKSDSSPASTGNEKKSSRDRKKRRMAESVAIEMSELESTRIDPKHVRGQRERPLLRSQSLADLTGFRPLSERERRRKR